MSSFLFPNLRHANLSSSSVVTYCSPGGTNLQMTLYYPQDTASLPVIMFIHGGGFFSGDMTLAANDSVAETLVQYGYVVASINYRLAPTYQWPDQIQDAKCAVRYLRANSASLHINSNEIGVYGESVGALLALLLGTTNSSAGFDVGQYITYSSAVNVVVEVSGPTDLVSLEQTTWGSRHHLELQQLMTDAFGNSNPPTAQLVAASPITYVSKNTAPTFIIQGGQDFLIVNSQAQELYTKLIGLGVNTAMVTVQNARHLLVPVISFLPQFPSQNNIDQLTVEFFNQYLPVLPSGCTFNASLENIAWSNAATNWNNFVDVLTGVSTSKNPCG